MGFDLIMDDIIYISDELLKEKILNFGELNSKYGRELNFNNNVDIIMIKHKEKNFYLKRLYFLFLINNYYFCIQNLNDL